MKNAEAKYRYAVGKDKFDPEVTNAVDKKKVSEKDAVTINKIQEMMRQERAKKGNRNIVTSENREDFMAKKLGLDKKSPEKEEKEDTEEHFIKHKPTGDMLGPYKSKSHADTNFDILNPKDEYEYVAKKKLLRQDMINAKKKEK